MKNVMILATSVVLMVGVAITGCSTNTQRADWDNPSHSVETSSKDDWDNPTDSSKSDWDNPSHPVDESKDDWDNPTDGTKSDWDNPSQSTESKETNEAGLYRHEVGGWVFYTEHDIDDYFGNDGKNDIFYASKMAEDVFQHEVFAEERGRVILRDQNDPKYPIILEYDIYNEQNKPDYHGTYVGFTMVAGYSFFVKCPIINDSHFYHVNGNDYLTNRETAELSLYICEHYYELEGGLTMLVGMELDYPYYKWTNSHN